jgi:hypothetical protein
MAIMSAKQYRNQLNSKVQDSDSKLYEDGLARIEKAIDERLKSAYPGWYVEVFLDTDTMRGNALKNIRLKLENLGYLVITCEKDPLNPLVRDLFMKIIVPDPDEPTIYFKRRIQSLLPRNDHSQRIMLNSHMDEGNSGLVLDILRETIRKGE